MTGTPFCMLPVTSLNSVKIGDGKVGEHFNSLLKQWSSNIDIDISNQTSNHVLEYDMVYLWLILLSIIQKSFPTNPFN